MSDQERQQFDPQRPQVIRARVKLEPTPEEKAVLIECQYESLFYRCLPISVVLGVGAQYLRQAGVLKGKYLGLSVALLTGYFAGKISYIPVCKKKFEERLPNSTYLQLMNGKITPQEFAEMKQHEIEAQIIANSDHQPYSNTQQYTDPQQIDGGFNDKDGENENVKRNVTYDELRRKHREQYGVNQPVTPVSPRAKFDTQQRTGEVDWSKSRMPDITPIDKGKKNQYGDVWDDGK